VNTDEAVVNIMKVIESYHEQAGDPNIPWSEEREREALRAILKVIIEEVTRMLVREAVKDVMKCLSQQKPTDMN